MCACPAPTNETASLHRWRPARLRLPSDRAAAADRRPARAAAHASGQRRTRRVVTVLDTAGADRRARIPGWLPEVAVAVAAAVLLVLISRHIPPRVGARSLDALGYACLVLAGASTGACRRWPRAATAVVTVVLCVFVARDYPNGPVWLTGWVAVAAVSWQDDPPGRVDRGVRPARGDQCRRRRVRSSIGPLIPLVFVGWLGAACCSASCCGIGGFAWPALPSGRASSTSLVRRWPPGGSQRIGCGSRATCTTASPMPWPRSTCRPARRPMY